MQKSCIVLNPFDVSLFTREWIEIPTATVTETDAGGLPLYEGVD